MAQGSICAGPPPCWARGHVLSSPRLPEIQSNRPAAARTREACAHRARHSLSGPRRPAVPAATPAHGPGRGFPAVSREGPRRCRGRSQKLCKEKKSQRHIQTSQRISTTAFKTFSDKPWNFNVVRGPERSLQPEPRRAGEARGRALLTRSQSPGFVFGTLCCTLDSVGCDGVTSTQRVHSSCGFPSVARVPASGTQEVLTPQKPGHTFYKIARKTRMSRGSASPEREGFKRPTWAVVSANSVGSHRGATRGWGGGHAQRLSRKLHLCSAWSQSPPQARRAHAHTFACMCTPSPSHAHCRPRVGAAVGAEAEWAGSASWRASRGPAHWPASACPHPARADAGPPGRVFTGRLSHAQEASVLGTPRRRSGAPAACAVSGRGAGQGWGVTRRAPSPGPEGRLVRGHSPASPRPARNLLPLPLHQRTGCLPAGTWGRTRLHAWGLESPQSGWRRAASEDTADERGHSGSGARSLSLPPDSRTCGLFLAEGQTQPQWPGALVGQQGPHGDSPTPTRVRTPVGEHKWGGDSQQVCRGPSAQPQGSPSRAPSGVSFQGWRGRGPFQWQVSRFRLQEAQASTTGCAEPCPRRPPLGGPALFSTEGGPQSPEAICPHSQVPCRLVHLPPSRAIS